jgi:hypothetical protein
MRENDMDEKRPDLRDALRELAEEAAGGLDPHVGLKRLIAYRQGALTADERDAVQDHLSLCPVCTQRFRELRNFETAAATGKPAGPESLRQEAWESLAEHLPQKASTIRPITSSARHRSRHRLPAFLYAAVAALLLAVLGLSIWMNFAMRQERRRLAALEQALHEREQALASTQSSLAEAERKLAEAQGSSGRESNRIRELEAQIAHLTATLDALQRNSPAPERREQIAAAPNPEISLSPRFAVRGPENSEISVLRGDGTVNPAHLTTATDRFRAALSLADRAVFDEYRITLTEQNGKQLWEGRRPGSALLGDAGTWISIRGLEPGRYRLRIEGVQADRRELLVEYLLDVTRG